MRITVDVPDDVAARVGGTPDAVADAAREALVVDAYRTGLLTTAEVQDALDLPTVDALDGCLKAHGVPLEYTEEDVAREGALIARLWPRQTSTSPP